jgi:hypothetical protein
VNTHSAEIGRKTRYALTTFTKKGSTSYEVYADSSWVTAYARQKHLPIATFATLTVAVVSFIVLPAIAATPAVSQRVGAQRRPKSDVAIAAPQTLNNARRETHRNISDAPGSEAHGESCSRKVA